MLQVLIALLFVVILILGYLLWKSQLENTNHRTVLSSDMAIVKTQLQSLGGIVGDVGAIRSQVEGVGTTVKDLGAIKSHVEGLSSTATDIGGIKSQVEAVSAAIQDLGAIKSQVESLSSTANQIGGIKSQVEAVSAATQDLGAIKSQVEALSTATQALGGIKSDLETLQRQDSQIGVSVQKISNKLIGGREVGAAGENLLTEAFASFPPGWIERDFRVGGRVVEFALVLANRKRLPIDSKWPASDLLERLGEETDPERRAALVDQIEDAVVAKAAEAAEYIDPARTIHLAVAAVPDSAYGVCRRAHFEAFGSHVLLISYSMALPVILAIYEFQHEYAGSVDQERLESHISGIADVLTGIENELQNRLARGSTMISNAYTECMAKVGQIRASLSALRAPAQGSGESPPSNESPRDEEPV